MFSDGIKKALSLLYLIEGSVFRDESRTFRIRQDLGYKCEPSPFGKTASFLSESAFKSIKRVKL